MVDGRVPFQMNENESEIDRLLKQVATLRYISTLYLTLYTLYLDLYTLYLDLYSCIVLYYNYIHVLKSHFLLFLPLAGKVGA